MTYREKLSNGIEITSTRLESAAQLEECQKIVFPTLADRQRLKREHYEHHLKLFPEGQFAALDNGKIVGATTTMRVNAAQVEKPHPFDDLACGGWLTAHDPKGEWLYGIDVMVLPEYRGKGIAKALYRARQELVQKLGLKGQRTVGMINGYGEVKHKMSAEEYFRKMKSGEIVDPTVNAQLRVGFELGNLIPEYLDDPACANYGVELILLAKKQIK